MSRRRVALFVLLAAAPLLLADVATAGDAEPAQPSFTELPTGAMSDPPTKKTPWGIGAGERATGFVVSRMAGEYTMIAATKTDMSNPPPSGAPTCFSQSVQNGVSVDGEPAAAEWGQPQAIVNLPSAAELGGRNGVTALHSERVVTVDATRASLEWVDAWVDPTTRGARLIAKGTLALRVVRNLPGGGLVFAGRDAERVHVVVVESATKKQSFGGREQLLSVSSHGATSASGCHHLRIGLHVEKGNSDTATLFTTAQLPSLPDAAPRAPLNGKPSNNLTTIRVRPVAIAASVSWATRDAEPVVAISAGWRAREQNVQALDNPAGF